ncbi:MAG: hypothetical protein ACRDM0_17065, partial [Thermoleophilaceae bacterium]
MTGEDNLVDGWWTPRDVDKAEAESALRCLRLIARLFQLDAGHLPDADDMVSPTSSVLAGKYGSR